MRTVVSVTVAGALARHARPDPPAQGGQALVLFALLLMSMLFMAALLFDGAQAIVHRRVLQNAADAGALAAANVIQSGGATYCNESTGGSTPRVAVSNEALRVAALNLAGASSTVSPVITVTCPSGYFDGAVKVAISGTSPSFFGGALRLAMSASEAAAWSAGIPVSAEAVAMHGGAPGNNYSVVVLNPYNPTWQSGTRGCPAVLFSGGPSVTFEGAMQVNSACPAASGGALGTNGNAATLTFNNGTAASLVGGFAPGPLVVTPYPLTGQPALPDPLRNLPNISTSALTTRSTSRLTINNTTAVLEPGIYVGGIRLQNTSKALLKPGIYYIDGGGIDVGAQAGIYTIASGVTTTSVTTWAADCPESTCGVLIYNRGSTSTLRSITVGAGGTVLLRPYKPAADLTGIRKDAYKNLLIWQAASPVPTSTYTQPDISLGGGGVFKVSGTLYAPSARVYMTGGSGGSGGGAIELTLQFIVWEMQIQGNSFFHFFYNAVSFASPIVYGLVE